MEYTMTKENMARLHRTYNVLFSIVLVIAGICLMAGVLCIYFSGDQPFSRESVAATFSQIAFPVYLCIAMAVINIIWEIISPTDEKKPAIKKKAVRKNSTSEEALSEKADFDAAEKKYRPWRNAFLVAAVIFIAAGLVNGGTIAVLAKAINICTECIGLG